MKLGILVTHHYCDANAQGLYPEMIRTQFNLLSRELNKYGIALEQIFWEDFGAGKVDISGFDAITPLTAWSYPKNQAAFLKCLEALQASGKTIINPIAVIKDNMNKSYLGKLSDEGLPVPPTKILTSNAFQQAYDLFDIFNCDEIIIKPIVGSGSWRQARLKRGETLPSAEELPPETALVQPFLKNVSDIGELSMLFFGSEFSHALLKTPKAGDYRSQTRYGAIEKNIAPPPEAIEASQQILNAYEENTKSTITYGRIDMVKSNDGNWLLMEAELIEPFLYLPFDGQGGNLGARNFATAIKNLLL